MSCNLGCAHHHSHGSCHSSCHTNCHGQSNPTYGWTGQQILNLNWAFGNRVDENYKISVSDINGLQQLIKDLNLHNHSNVKLTQNITTSPTGFTDDPVTTNHKKKTEHITQIRSWIDKLAVINSTNHKHRCWDGVGVNNKEWVSSVIWGTDTPGSTEWNHAIPNIQTIISSDTKITKDAINNLRDAFEALKGHQHWMCTCNCNYTACHTNR